MKTLTRNERIFKAKLIAEWSIKKDEQKYINTLVESGDYTYRRLYRCPQLTDDLLFRYSLHKQHPFIEKTVTIYI